MTKSTITRERLQEIAEDGFLKHGESKELARMALTAMDSEPVAYWRKALRADGVCYADGINSKRFHDDNPPFPLEDGDYWEIIPLYRHAQSAPEYPETLPCPVVLEPGMRFGKGVQTRLVLDAIQRRAEHYAELDAMTPDERAEYETGIAAFKSMLPQPALVATSEEHRQLRDLVMMVKMLCRTVRKYNPESQQAANFIAYLQKEGLISAADCLRDSDLLGTESEDRRG